MVITIRSSNAQSGDIAFIIATDGTVLIDNYKDEGDGFRVLGFDVKEYIARYGALDPTIDILDIGYLWERPVSHEHTLITGETAKRGYEAPASEFREAQRKADIEKAMQLLMTDPTKRNPTVRTLPEFHYVTMGPGCEVMRPLPCPIKPPDLVKADFASVEIRVAEHMAKVQPIAEAMIRPRDPLSDNSCTGFGEVFLTVADVLEVRPDLSEDKAMDFLRRNAAQIKSGMIGYKRVTVRAQMQREGYLNETEKDSSFGES